MGIFEILLRKGADGFGDGIVLVDTWTCVVRLYEGMYLAIHKLPFVVQAHGDDGCIAADTGNTDACRSAEVTEAVSDKMTFVDLDSTTDMGTVAVDKVGTVVDAEMREGTQRASVLTEEGLGALGQVRLVFPFGATVEGNDEDVARISEISEDGTHLGGVLMTVGVAVVSRCLG